MNHHICILIVNKLIQSKLYGMRQLASVPWICYLDTKYVQYYILRDCNRLTTTSDVDICSNCSSWIHKERKIIDLAGDAFIWRNWLWSYNLLSFWNLIMHYLYKKICLHFPNLSFACVTPFVKVHMHCYIFLIIS